MEPLPIAAADSFATVSAQLGCSSVFVSLGTGIGVDSGAMAFFNLSSFTC